MEVKTVKGVKSIWWWVKDEEVCLRGVWLSARHCDLKYLMRTTCKREDCPICGSEKSVAHFRRWLRGIPFIKEMIESGYVGYLVVTCPEEKRLKWGDKKELRKVARYIIRLLQRKVGSEIKGVYRWHFAGNKGRKWYPHLNVLFTFGYIGDEMLNELKRLIERRLGVRVVYYRYTKKISKVRHWWLYISRPTFLLQDEVEYEKVKNMKNVIWFGKFKEKEKEYDKMTGEEFLERVYKMFLDGYFGEERKEAVKLMARFIILKGRCIRCGEKLKWERLRVNKNEIDNTNNDWKELGWGFYVRKDGLG